MKNKLYDYHGFKIYEVVDHEAQGQYLGPNFWKYYCVEMPDGHGTLHFDYYKQAEEFCRQATLAYEPYDLFTNRGIAEFKKDAAEVRHYLNDLYASHNSLEPTVPTYRMTAQIQRLIGTLARYATLPTEIKDLFPMDHRANKRGW